MVTSSGTPGDLDEAQVASGHGPGAYRCLGTIEHLLAAALAVFAERAGLETV